MNVWFQTDEAAQQRCLQGPLCLGMRISVFKANLADPFLFIHHPSQKNMH